MKTMQAVVSLLPVALGLSMACTPGGGGASPGAMGPGITASLAPTPTVAAAPAPAASEGRRGEGLDPTDGLLRASRGLDLTDTQRATIAALEDTLEVNERDTRAAFRMLQIDLAVQVRAGAIDHTRVRTDENAAIDALQAHIAKETETLDRLHATLDSSQRSAAVAAVRAGPPGRAEAQGEGTPATPSKEDAVRRTAERMTRELGLDTTQEQRLSTLLAERAASREAQDGDRRRRTSTVLDAFPSDIFQAGAVVTGGAMAPLETVRAGIDRQVTFLSKLLPILREDQRSRLATSLESRQLGAEAGGD